MISAILNRVIKPLPRPPNALAEKITGRSYISWSQINTMRSCPLRFSFHYVQHEKPEFLASSLLFGGAIHGALEFHFRCRMEGLRDTLPALFSVFNNHWKNEREKYEDVPIKFNKDQDEASMKALAERMLGAFVASPMAEPAGEVLAVEEELKLTLDDDLPDVLAIVDLAWADDKAMHLADFKTSRSRWNDQKLKESADQLLLYHHMASPISSGLDLPGRDQLQKIAQAIATEKEEMPTGDDLVKLLDATAGLTRYEAEGAFSLSLVRHGKLKPEAIWELKTQALKKSGLLNLHRGNEYFDDLGGLDAIKEFCTKALQPNKNGVVKPRGILLLGVPGTGKSAFAKALGHETGRPTLILDVGSLMGSLVGQTESNIRHALKIVDAMSPCILFCDEIEKGLSGVASSGQTDSGVSARLFGSLLTWLSDHTSDVFFIGTCNDVSKLPPEFSRAERFDGIFFLDLPTAREKEAIWALYTHAFNIPTKQATPRDTDWTGAEIKSCCRLASLLGMSLADASKHVVPVAVTAGESVEKLRAWASGRCLSASTSGIYARNNAVPSTPIRRVARPVEN